MARMPGLGAFGAVALLLANQAVTAGPGNTFSPSSVTVNQGETVMWTNAGGDHNVVFEDGTFTEPAAPDTSMWTRSRRFDAVGSFGYYCEAHRAVGMTGTVTVLAVGSPSPQPSPAPAPGAPAPGAPAPPATRITLAIGDATPRAGRRVRFSGFVSPAHDGARLQIQRRTRRVYRTVATTRLRDAGASRSRYSIRLRIRSDGRYRARLPATGATSPARRVNVI
jgi:plastocyanin